jgi:dihydroorotate dehydrogenase (NAD+) catalytic subunit
MGGVQSGRDVLELIACGATHVALGTVLFSDPGAPARIRAEMLEECRRAGFDRPDDAFGVALDNVARLAN